MKKLLLLAAVALLGSAMASASSGLHLNKKYLLKPVSATGVYVNLESADNATLQETGTPIHISPYGKTGTGQFFIIQNVGGGDNNRKFLAKGSNTWDTAAKASTNCGWTLSMVDTSDDGNPIVTISNGAAGDGTYLGLDATSTGSKLYYNKNATTTTTDGTITNQWELVPVDDSDYFVLYDATETASHDNRYVGTITLTQAGGSTQTLSTGVSGAKGKMYVDKTSDTDPAFTLYAGATYSGDFSGSVGWTNSYAYIDWDKDGSFDVYFSTTGAVEDMADAVSYSNLFGNNSVGGSGGNAHNLPAFTIPSDVTPGTYRMRFKSDWSNLDPAGNPGDVNAASNEFKVNGGFIIDVNVEIKSGVTVTYNLTMPDGTTSWTKTVAGVTPSTDASTLATSTFAGLGLDNISVTSASETSTDMSITDSNKTFAVTGDWKAWYGKVGRLRSRNGGRCTPNGSDYITMDYWKYNGTNIVSNANTDNTEFDQSRFFILNPEIDTNGDFCVSVQNVLAGNGKYFNQTASSTAGTFTTTKQLYKVCSTPALTDSDNNSYFGIALNVSGNAYVQDCGAAGKISAWAHDNAQNDNGSHIAFHALTDDDFTNATTWTVGEVTCTFVDANKTAAKTSRSFADFITLFTPSSDEDDQINGASYAATYNNLIALVAGLKDRNVSFDSDAESAWNTLVGTTELTTATKATLAAAQAAYTTLLKKATGHYKIANNNAGTNTDKYLGVNDAYTQVKKTADTETRTTIFTLDPAEDGSGFYLKNEYTQKYLYHPINDNKESALNATKAEATVYQLDLASTTDGVGVGFKAVSNISNENANRLYLHTNFGTWCVAGATRWSYGEGVKGSQWVLSAIDESEALKAHIEGMTLPTANENVGTGVGKYLSLIHISEPTRPY